MKTKQVSVAAVLIVAIGALIAGFIGEMKGQQPVPPTSMQVPFLHELAGGQTANPAELTSLERADAWLNSPPLTAVRSAWQGRAGRFLDLHLYQLAPHGSVCPRLGGRNTRTRDWWWSASTRRSSRSKRTSDNVRWAVKDMQVDYPVAVDSEHVIWRAFSNQYWPALYFIDAKGRVRYQYFGEGAYAQSEMMIQALLREAGASDVSREVVSVDASGLDVAADWRNLISGKLYQARPHRELRLAGRGSAGQAPHVFVARRLRLNEWALRATGPSGGMLSALNKPGGRIAYRFHARDLHIVMGAAAPGVHEIPRE